MAFSNFFLNFNITRPNFNFNLNFGCFSMPKFFSFSPFFSSCDWGQMPFFNRYLGATYLTPPSVFNISNNLPYPTVNTTPYFNDFYLNATKSYASFSNCCSNTTNSWQNPHSIAFDTFETTTKKQTRIRSELDSKKTKKKEEITKKDKKIHSSVSYANLSKSEAEKTARLDSNLERLRGGNGWSISNASFQNDIPYAGNGINKFLDNLSSQIGENLVITSALGTSTSPHAKNGGHYDARNPKLDFGGGLSLSDAKRLKSKLASTGYFTRLEIETHGNTAHIDAKIKDSVLAEYA